MRVAAYVLCCLSVLVYVCKMFFLLSCCCCCYVNLGLLLRVWLFCAGLVVFVVVMVLLCFC